VAKRNILTKDSEQQMILTARGGFYESPFWAEKCFGQVFSLHRVMNNHPKIIENIFARNIDNSIGFNRA
jgi:hypothetical protein